MNRWQNTLLLLETRLQALIEGSAARLFPAEQSHLAAQRALLQALHDAIRQGNGGAATAPSLFLLSVDLNAAASLQSPAAIEQLTDDLYAAGQQAGVLFTTPPRVQIVIDPLLPPGEFRVAAPSEEDPASETLRINLAAQSPAANGAYLIIVQDAQTFPLTRSVTNIGRREGNHITILDARVSRSHAQIRFNQGRFEIFDLDSTGGTYVNDQRVTRAALHPGDVISLAGVTLIFGEESDPEWGNTQRLIPPGEGRPSE